MTQLSRRVEENAGRAVRRAAVVADQVVTLATPVDTGRARSNWRVAIDRPADGFVGALDQSGQSAIAIANSVIATFRSRVNRAIHITNNLDYIVDLERGSSAQAPEGMTRKAVQAARETLDGVKLLGQ
jgi:hypothetical protein